MAGIHVSGGGVFSGSGDLTAEWFWAEYNTAGTGRVYLPDGTFTLTGERSNLAFAYQWQGSSDYLYHQSGTVKITYGGGTQVNTDGAAPVNATTGRKGQFYDLIVDQGSNPRATDPVLLVTRESSANYMGIENSLTIVSGTARIGNTTATNTTKIGHVYIGASGTFSAGNVATVNNAGYNNWDSSGSISVQSVIFNGNNGVFVGNGGTIEVLGPYSGNDSDHYVWENNLKGTVYHNNGTIQFGGVGLLAIGQTSENATYNNYKNNDRPADGTGQSSNGDGGYLYNMSVGFRDGDSPSRHLGLQAVSNILVGNDLTVLTSGGIDKSTYGSTISGSVELQGWAYWGNYANQGGTNTWGRLYMSEGSYFKAPTGTLVLNKVIGGYTMYNPEGTFVHNNGNVAINFTGTDATVVRNQSMFYNYEQTLPAPTNRVNWRGKGSAPYAFTIANNATIKEGSFRPTAPSHTMVISGALEVQSGGNYGYVGGDFEVSSSIGSVDIKSGGNMYASTDLTTVGNGAIPAVFSNDGTFHHNSGSVTMEYGAGGDTIITGSSRTIFNKLNTGFGYAHSGFIVEDTWATTGDGGGATGFYKDGANWAIGTTSSTGYLVTNVGVGIKSAINPIISGASEAFPAVVSGTKFDFHTATTTLNNVIFTDAQTSDDNATINVSNVDFQGGLTTNDSTTQTLTVTSGTWVKYGGNFLPGDGTKEIVSGATVIFDGTASYLQDNSATSYGRGDGATLWWNSTGYYSPNGGYLNNGWENVFWNADARINQDSVFRNSNLIVAKQFSASNRPIGSTSESQMLKSIRVLNGGTVSSSTNVFKIQNTGTFNTRGGFFTSSSALDLDGNEYATMGDGMGTATAVTLEAWVKPSEAPYENTMIGTDGSKGGILSSNTLNKIRVKHESVNSSYTDIDYNWVVDKWVNICFTWDGSTGKVYADGKLLKSFALSGSPYGLTKACIGTLRDNGDWPWEGNIARASIWKTALTGPQVRQMMFYDWGAVDASSIDDTKCCGWYQFNEGLGTSISDMSGSGNTATLTGSSPWATAGNWNANTLSGAAHTGKLYIGTGVTPTVFTNSTFELANRELIVGSKFASKSHKGTTEYYIATSGTNDWLNYQKIEEAASIGTVNDVKILANGSHRSYFNFDSNANNEQCNTLVNAGYVRIVTNADFYTQDFDNSQGEWIRSDVYGGTIHDDGSTPHEYEPIDLMDDLDSYFDTEELND